MKISQASGVPIYQQIADSFREQILAGKYKEGEYLQSIRSLARELSISVITTMKAYEILENEGLITAVQGKGFYVNAMDTELLQEQHKRKVEEALLEAIAAARVAGMSNAELSETLSALIQVGELEN